MTICKKIIKYLDTQRYKLNHEPATKNWTSPWSCSVAMACHPTLINPPDKVQSHLIYLESQWRRAQSSQGGTR